MSRDPADPDQQTGREAAIDLMRRIKAETPRWSQWGGWPPANTLPRLLADWFANYGLHIDDPLPGDVPDDRPAANG